MSHIVFLHGALGARDQCAPLAERLGDVARAHGVTLHLTEFEGHGSTPSLPRPLRIEHLAEEVLAELDARGVASAACFGYSMGGYVALWLARHHPARVDRVMTLATKLRWTEELARREATMLDVPTLRAKVPKFTAALEARHGTNRWEELVHATREMMAWMGTSAPLGEDDFRTIGVPVRLTVGDRDATVSVEECITARALIPLGELEVLPATPHPLERVDLERLAASASAFLFRTLPRGL